MMNEAQANQNYTATASFTVQSAAFQRVEFGSISLPSLAVNAILVEFTTGAEYIYIGVSDELMATLQREVAIHIQTDGQHRIGGFFNTNLFRRHRAYARLHGC